VKGVIFNAVEEAVVKLYSEDVWDDLLDAAGVSGRYTSLGSYDDSELIALVEAAVEMTGIDATELIKVLGRHSFPHLASRYPELVSESDGTHDFLRRVNDIIHPEVLKLHPDATPPQFEFEQRSDGALRITYHSVRKLGVLAQGLMYGAADKFGEEIEVDVISGLAEVSPDAVIARLERRLERERDARRQAEEISERGMRDLWIANRELDARVEERTQDLAATLEQLRIATSARDRFLSTLSHEMRTPLNGVLGMLELLGPHLAGEQGKDYLEVATESADRLYQLVTRLLDLVELDSGSFTTNRTTVAVRELAEVIRGRWQAESLRSGHLLTVWSEGNDDCFVDEPRIVQIANELIENAITHATPGAIRVALHSSARGFDLSVADAGPGISPDLIPDLLNSDFSMVDDTAARTAQGLGLGLGICRRMAEAIGGTLSLAGNDDAGTTALLSMPTNDSPDPHYREANNS